MDETANKGSVSLLSPLAHSTFRAIWLANLSSNFGTVIQSLAAAWLMTSLTASASFVALVQASTALPIMLFSLTSGALADLYDQRKVMLVAQAFLLAVSAALTLTTYGGLITPWLLLTFTFLIGCGTALNNPSWQASVGELVPRSDLPSAIALNSIGFNLTRSVGPAIGGAIVAAAGAAVAFAVNAVSYLPVIFVLARWKREAAPTPLPRETLGMAMTAGLRYVALSPNIGKVLLRSFVFGFTAVSIIALLPLVARDQLGGGPFTFGLMLGSFGVGAIAGAFLSGQLRSRLSGEAIIRLAFLGFMACAIGTAASPYPWVTGGALMVGGSCWVIALSRFNATVQLATPRWVVGRALSIYQTATFGGMALGSWVWGYVADQQGVDIALLSSGALMLAGAALGLPFALPEDSALSLDPLGRFKEPHLALDLKPRSGPILVMIEFRIRQGDTEAFLRVMAERRRIRLRDGARNWNLARDLEDPEIWLESYHTPTWTEYVRHNQRATLADAAVGEQLRALHHGDQPPRVRRMIERPTEAAMPAPPKPGVRIP